jgi:hypothetical protein
MTTVVDSSGTPVAISTGDDVTGGEVAPGAVVGKGGAGEP